MPNKRLAMRHIKEILRLKLEAKLSHRKISRCLNIGVGTISLYSKRAKEVGLTWPLPSDLSDNDLEQLLFPSPKVSGRHGRIPPDCAAIHQELKRKGVTKQLLWEEYKQAYGNAGYQFSQYCNYYRDWLHQQKRSMRQIHTAGEKLFVDYSGATMPVVNPDTGEIRFAEIFVAVLGASNYTFAMASWTQRKADWIEAHAKAFEFFGGVPEIVVPDQLRSAVSKPCRYEPTINASYQHMASHYKTAIIPARPLKPKDKAKAENAVLIVVEVQASREGVAIFFKGQQVARHARSLRQGGFSTQTPHMPEAHQHQQTWTPQRLMNWGKRIGSSTEALVTILLEQKQHPEQAYRACLGLLNLAKQYSPERLDAACLRAIHIKAPRLKNVKSILQSNMDQLPLPAHPEQATMDLHPNVRGSDYYH